MSRKAWKVVAALAVVMDSLLLGANGDRSSPDSVDDRCVKQTLAA
jgi:hypothetical protein